MLLIMLIPVIGLGCLIFYTFIWHRIGKNDMLKRLYRDGNINKEIYEKYKKIFKI